MEEKEPIKYARGCNPRSAAALRQSWSKEHCAAGGRNSSISRKKQKAVAARIEDVREACAAVAFTKIKSFNPETKQEESVYAYTMLIKKLFDIGMSGNVQAIKLFTELMFFTPENQKALINIETSVHTAMPANIDDFETLRKLRKNLLFADGIEDAEVISDGKDDDKTRDIGVDRPEPGPGEDPAED